MGSRAWRLAALLTVLFGLLASALLDRLAPLPSADVARGSEEAFVTGLEPREFLGPQKQPTRWTRERAQVQFRNLPPGPRSLEVAVMQQRGPVVVAVDGAILGVMPPGTVRFPLAPSSRKSLSVELQATTFDAGGGRRLGVQLQHVSLHHERGGLPPVGLIVATLGVALGVLVAAAVAGLGPWAAGAAALFSVSALAALLWPMGLLRSGYSVTLPLLILSGAALACGFARGRRSPLAFAALLVAWLVQAVALTSPMVVTSDAVMHANKLMQVARGDFYPTSRTQHAPPFEFPYGVSFYALLAPLARLGLEPVALVRSAAGWSGALAAVPLFLLVESVPARALLAVLLLQLLPVTSDLMSYGNLSNVFGQTLTLAFLAWWRAPKGGAALGALLLVTAALSHLSSAIVLAVLVPLLFLFAGRGRARTVAVVLGTALAAAYYLQFLPMIVRQLPRLAEGAAAGGRSLGPLDAIFRQLQEAVMRWGIPATLLAAVGLARPAASEAWPLQKAAWISGAMLAILACVSPLEVRYLHAIAFAVAVAATDGTRLLCTKGALFRAAAAGLLGWQAFLFLSGMKQILLERYRIPL